MNPILTICIPTYNRAHYLQECLNSILRSGRGFEFNIEILVSDNASEDDTVKVVESFRKNYPLIKLNRNDKNIGGERNFRLLASLAQGKYIWIFGDDDEMDATAIPRVFENIRAGYDLTVCNYSIWDKQLSVLIKQSGLPAGQDQIFYDPNKLMEFFGLHLGYISSIVMKKDLFLKLSPEEYEAYVAYGFPFLFAVYNGLANEASKSGYIAEPLFRNRAGNSGRYDWYKFFVKGSSLIFDELQHKGYSKSAVRAAKHQVLRDFVIPSSFGLRLKMKDQDKKQVLGLLFTHYKTYWQFWVFCLPRSLIPESLIIIAKKLEIN